MKAVQFKSYGESEVVEILEAPIPSPKEGQILIENYSSSINPIDWKVRNGYLQKMAPLDLPVTLGGDFAGKVTEVGEGVTQFSVGDEVYGQAIVLNGGSGSMAEVVVANVKNSGLKPKNVNFEEASALPLAGASALQAVIDHIGLQVDQKILIHGGAGGIGHLAIQIAKSVGAYVATTVKTEDMEFARSLGADEVIDYKTQKFEEILKDYDAVFDTVGGETADKSFNILKNGGIIVSMAGAPNPELAAQKEITAIGQMTDTNTDRLDRLTALVDDGKVKVKIGKTFSLDEARDAFVFQEKSHPQGKIVITAR